MGSLGRDQPFIDPGKGRGKSGLAKADLRHRQGSQELPVSPDTIEDGLRRMVCGRGQTLGLRARKRSLIAQFLPQLQVRTTKTIAGRTSHVFDHRPHFPHHLHRASGSRRVQHSVRHHLELLSSPLPGRREVWFHPIEEGLALRGQTVARGQLHLVREKPGQPDQFRPILHNHHAQQIWAQSTVSKHPALPSASIVSAPEVISAARFLT